MCAAYYAVIESTIKPLYFAWYTHFTIRHACMQAQSRYHSLSQFIAGGRSKSPSSNCHSSMFCVCARALYNNRQLITSKVSAQNIKYDDVLRLHGRWSVTTIEDSPNGLGHIHYVLDAHCAHTHTHTTYTTHDGLRAARCRHWLSIIIRWQA